MEKEMYRITSEDGTLLGLTEELRFIKRGIECDYVQAESEEDAIGIAFNGQAFNLPGRTDIEGAPSVSYARTSLALEFAAQGEVIDGQKQVAEIAFVIMAEAGTIDDTTAAEHADVFEEWQPSVTYKQGDIRRHEGSLYKCVQGHTSQVGWEPSKEASLWTKIGDPAEEFPEWSRPLGAHDAWARGAKCSHNGEKWVSDYDNNVWEPGVFGWHKYVEEDEQ